MIRSGVLEPVNLEPVILIDKNEVLVRLQQSLDFCNHTSRCEICLGVRIALNVVKGME